MASSPARLTSIQRDLLLAFFEHERGFFLTGGAALSGFYLYHRETTDLDFFTHDPEAFERGAFALRAAAAQVGAEVRVKQDAPGFRRYLVSRGEESVLVDTVWERVPAAYPHKREEGRIILDSPEEITVNKLTTLVSRSEPRDIVDLMLLERSGCSIEAALPKALEKDGGCTPATIAWVLSQVSIADGARLPGGVSVAETRAFLSALVERLLKAAVPPPK
jgi:predicted nucleotidyltransferase component of viral defense system